MEHPIVAFHREALTCSAWSTIRDDFYFQFLDRFENTTWRNSNENMGKKRWSCVLQEPKKFRRHCKEALGKWILSQKGRESGINNAGSISLQSPDPFVQIASKELFFLPHHNPNSDGYFEAPEGKAARTSYDSQLIRDLSLKCAPKVHHDNAFFADLDRFVTSDFNLFERCSSAHFKISAAINVLLAKLTPDAEVVGEKRQRQDSASFPFAPELRVVEPTDNRNSLQSRIEGRIVVLGIQGGNNVAEVIHHGARSGWKINPKIPFGSDASVSLPEPVWHKMCELYKTFGKSIDEEKFGGQFPVDNKNNIHIPKTATTLSSEIDPFTFYRCATLALRYEANLSSGSLQLCADPALKETFQTEGYHVIDLCASPINAFVSTKAPQTCNVFCSAFFDTDYLFGSLGSATTLDVTALENPQPNSWVKSRLNRVLGDSGQLCLTLDVPYDEDLCNLLFLKLKEDCDSNVLKKTCFLLVLPLWWNIPFENCKKQLVDGTSGTTASAAMAQGVSYLEKGFTVKYPWPEELSKTKWAEFDAIFVKDTYSYFCTVSNKFLDGVTATEVIGFGNPTVHFQTSPKKILEDFYFSKK